MTITYNKLTPENLDAIKVKAKVKADGCYTFRGIMYRVIRSAVSHYACSGDILENYGSFHVLIGSYSRDSECMKLLKGI